MTITKELIFSKKSFAKFNNAELNRWLNAELDENHSIKINPDISQFCPLWEKYILDTSLTFEQFHREAYNFDARRFTNPLDFNKVLRVGRHNGYYVAEWKNILKIRFARGSEGRKQKMREKMGLK